VQVSACGIISLNQMLGDGIAGLKKVKRSKLNMAEIINV
jgi:hypothetical protein